MLFAGVIGSHAHGTNLPPEDPFGTDDQDLVTIMLPPSAVCLGLDTWDHATQWVDQYDVIAYSLGKVLRLLAKSNPNVLGLLALPSDCILYEHPVWQELCAQRHLFLTKEAYGAFAGYANGQLKRMAHSAYNGYMGEKRKQIVDRIGYDTKNAAHLIRLLRMCTDLFQFGELRVRRSDAPHLIAIKRGEVSLAEVQREAAHLFDEANTWRELSSLPDRIHRGAVSELSAALHLKGWGK